MKGEECRGSGKGRVGVLGGGELMLRSACATHPPVVGREDCRVKTGKKNLICIFV